jgi:hypothetical protein
VMRAATCSRCGRERGIRHYQCHPDELAECLGVALARAERERDEAREALRLAETTRDAAQAIASRDTAWRREYQESARTAWARVTQYRCEAERMRPAARLDMKRRMQLAAALGKRGFKREPMGRRGAMLGWRHLLDQVQSAAAQAERGCATVYNLGGLKARAEADELRKLAWSWCIEARAERMRATLEQARAQRAICEAAELERDECPPQPIESLGPVPLSASHMADMSDGYTVGVSREMRTLAWLVRDAVRRGAKLQGGE